MLATVTDALASIDDYVQGIQFDDSAVPYFQLALVFFVLEYIARTYLDVRQIKTIKTADPPDELKHYSKEHLTTTRAYSLDKKTCAHLRDWAMLELDSVGPNQ
jgi:hypothetical protein